VIDGQSVLVLEKSNSFKYIEQVSALYVNYSRQNKDVNFQAGLRMENTNSIGDLARANGIKKDDDKVARNYTDLFPSTAIGYKINENNRLNLTYSRRIDRPTYSSLNPFEFKLDELTFRKGNAFLQPQYSNVIELRHAYKGMANFSASYTQTDDFGSFIFDTLNANASYFQQRNVGTKKVFNVSAGANLNVTKWWSSYVNCWWSYLIMDGKIGSTPIKSELPMWGSNIQMAFTLPAEYSVEVSGWVRGPSVSGISIFLQPMGSLDIGAQKQLWNKNATIKLSVTDILYTSIENFKSNINGLGINTMYRGESRTVRLSFSYRFGSAQIAAERQRKSGIEGEKNRIN
jgi:hypothetical protein